MSRHEIVVPRLGEGIENVKVTNILVGLGGIVSRDTPLVEVETDKATHVIESPATGTISEIHCQLGSVLRVGAVMAVIAADGSSAHDGRSSIMSPDGLEDDLPTIVIRKRQQVRMSARAAREPEGGNNIGPEVHEGTKHEFSPKQLLIARGLRESQSVPVATIEMEVDWGRIEDLRRQTGGGVRPSGLELVAWAVVRAMREHQRFCSVRSPSGEYWISEHHNIGIAVALPDDELTIASVQIMGRTDFFAFLACMRTSVQSAAEWGSASGVALVISDMSSFGVIAATPVVVAPSVATLFIGAPEWRPQRGEDNQLVWVRIARLILAFDHGLINGAGAANFINQVIDSLSSYNSKEVLGLDLAPTAVRSQDQVIRKKID